MACHTLLYTLLLQTPPNIHGKHSRCCALKLQEDRLLHSLFSHSLHSKNHAKATAWFDSIVQTYKWVKLVPVALLLAFNSIEMTLLSAGMVSCISHVPSQSLNQYSMQPTESRPDSDSAFSCHNFGMQNFCVALWVKCCFADQKFYHACIPLGRCTETGSLLTEGKQDYHTAKVPCMDCLHCPWTTSRALAPCCHCSTFSCCSAARQPLLIEMHVGTWFGMQPEAWLLVIAWTALPHWVHQVQSVRDEWQCYHMRRSVNWTCKLHDQGPARCHTARSSSIRNQV